jgi:hypothetical protein
LKDILRGNERPAKLTGTGMVNINEPDILAILMKG